MKKTKKKIALVLTALAVLTATVFAVKTENTTGGTGSAIVEALPTAVLQNGSRGSEVKEVQRRLKQWFPFLTRRQNAEQSFSAWMQAGTEAMALANGL